MAIGFNKALFYLYSYRYHRGTPCCGISDYILSIRWLSPMHPSSPYNLIVLANEICSDFQNSKKKFIRDSILIYCSPHRYKVILGSKDSWSRKRQIIMSYQKIYLIATRLENLL